MRAIDFNVGPIDAKLGGVIMMFGSIVVWFFVPWLDRCKVRSGAFRPMFKWFFWLWVINFLGLIYLGAQPAEGVYLFFAKLSTAYYFIYFLVILPFLPNIETTKPLPASISESVLSKNATQAAE